MASISVALPLTQDSADGYTMLKDFKSTIKQNLKMLILTIPGERVMDPMFGVGIKKYLFENYGTDTYARIEAKIREQTQMYIPAVAINKILFRTPDADSGILDMAITYSIPSIGSRDILEFTI